MKLSNFLQELLSVLLTPFILILSLPRSAAAIVDFFREFTVHVDGIGYVCSFAVFDFKRQGKVGVPFCEEWFIFELTYEPQRPNTLSWQNLSRRMKTQGSRSLTAIVRWRRVSCISR